MPEDKRSRLAAFAFAAAIGGVVIALGGIAGVQLGLLPPIGAFFLFALGTLVFGGIATVAGGISILRTRTRFGPAARQRAINATAIGVVLVAVVIVAASGGRDKPPINDITTDLVDPPLFTATAGERDMSYPDAFVPIVEQAYPDLRPIELAATPDNAYERAIASARALGWQITFEDPQAGVFEATETSAIFQFVDDVSVRVREQDAGVRIDVRSKSRDGRGDLGANADRIQRFASEVQLPPVAAK